MSPLNSDKGLVFDIQRFSIHDGPGIRTTVFFKGCHLRCLWCSNPESQSFSPSLLIRNIKCRGCGKCAQTCPTGAISMNEEKERIINWGKCDQCMMCVSACIYQSLICCGQYMTVGEILSEVMKDVLFYKNSSGGVTISGGEPFHQPLFLERLLRALKENEIHVTLETSGYVSRKIFENVLPLVDLVLLDIKHLDDEKHRRLTGVSNQRILANARIAAGMARTWFRVPLIENVNDDVNHIERMAELGREIGIEKISILPYHEGGIQKCSQIGKAYLIPEAKSPSNDHIETLRGIILEKGGSITIGN
ncbi:MAG: glycyl-radical enzyme activating protein [Syntrophobacteraceae bacterium]